MAGLQALEAYLDIWCLYQTDTFHAKIIINTCEGVRFEVLSYEPIDYHFDELTFVTVTTQVSH